MTIAGLLLLVSQLPAPTGVTTRVIRATTNPDTDVVEVRWTLPAGTPTFTHTRLVVGTLVPPAPPADMDSAFKYHQFPGARSVDTFSVAGATTPVATKVVVRVGNATGASPFAASAVVCFGRNAACLPPPPPAVPQVTTVAVAPVAVTLAVGEFTVQLYGFRAFSDGRGGATVTTLLWTSSDTAVVKVALGVVSPVGPGTATVTATDSSRTVSATSRITVLPQRQVPVFGQSVWTGAYALPLTDSTGTIRTRLVIVVRGP